MCYTTIGEGYKSYFLNHIVLREQNEFEKQSRSKEWHLREGTVAKAKFRV
jgi:hypothetical protein